MLGAGRGSSMAGSERKARTVSERHGERAWGAARLHETVVCFARGGREARKQQRYARPAGEGRGAEAAEAAAMTARPPSPRAWRWSALERAGRRVGRGAPLSARRPAHATSLFADDYFLIAHALTLTTLHYCHAQLRQTKAPRCGVRGDRTRAAACRSTYDSTTHLVDSTTLDTIHGQWITYTRHTRLARRPPPAAAPRPIRDQCH